MASPSCGCGCGTELKQRKDGTFANYSPGGHDAKHKSALVGAARDGDKAALKLLKKKGWEKFLEKGPKKTRAQVQQRVKKPTLVEPAWYGLSEYDVMILTKPPTPDTWYCQEDHAGHGKIMVSGSDITCWFCHTSKPQNPELVWPQFESAFERLRNVNWEKAHVDARLDERMSMISMPEVVANARALMKLKARHLDAAEQEIVENEQLVA